MNNRSNLLIIIISKYILTLTDSGIVCHENLEGATEVKLHRFCFVKVLRYVKKEAMWGPRFPILMH